MKVEVRWVKGFGSMYVWSLDIAITVTFHCGSDRMMDQVGLQTVPPRWIRCGSRSRRKRTSRGQSPGWSHSHVSSGLDQRLGPGFGPDVEWLQGGSERSAQFTQDVLIIMRPLNEPRFCEFPEAVVKNAR